MAVTDIVSGSNAVIPYSVCRDSNDIPYVLVMDNTTLKVYKGNQANPTSWSSATVGDGTVRSAAVEANAAMVIGTYSGTEYIFVARIDSGNDLVFDKSTIAAFSFPSGNTVEIAADQFVDVSMDYGNSERIGIHYRSSLNVLRFVHSTNGGTSWSTPFDTWDTGNEPVGSSVAVQGSYWHLMARLAQTGNNYYTKRWSSSGGLEYWNGSSWQTVSDTADGLDTGISGTPNGNGANAGKATSNIIVFAGTRRRWSNQTIYSRNGGQSWVAITGMGVDNYAGPPSFTIKTEAGEVDDVWVWAGNTDSNYNDTNYKVYDYSADSQGSWTLIWDSGDTSDTVYYLAGLLLQQNGWVDFAYQFYDASATTYYVKFNQYETGSAGATYTKTYTADTILKLITTKTYTADVLLKALGLTKTYTADMLLKLIATKTYDADTILKLIATKTYTADLLLQDTLTKTYQADVLLKALGLTKAYQADVLLKALGLTKTYQADLILIAVLIKTYSADLLLQALGLTTTYTADVILGTAEFQTFTKSYLADLILWQKTAFSQNNPVFTRDDKILIQNAPIFTRRT